VSKRLKRRVIGAVPWSVAESVVNGLAGLALTFVLAWFLEPMEVGQATIALAVVGVIEIIAGLGLVEALIGAKSGDTRVSDTAFTAVFFFAAVAAGLCWFLAGPIGRFYGQPHVAQLLEVAALILPVNALAAIPTGLLVRKMRAAVLTLRMMTGRVVTILATAVLAYLHYGAWALVLGTLAGSCANVLILAPAMLRWPRPRFSRAEFVKLVRFGAAFSMERLLWGLLPRLFWLVVGYVHGPATLGYFQFAQRLIDETANLVQTFSIRFGLSFFAALERARRDPTAAFLKATRLMTAIGAPVFTGLALVMPDLVGTIFSAKWAPAIIVSQVAALGWVLSFPRVLVGPVLRARGRQGGLVLYATFAFAVTVTAGLLTGGYGLLAVGLAWVSRHVIGIPWSFYATQRYLGIPLRVQIAASIRPIIAAAFMACVVIGTATVLHDAGALKRLIAEVVFGGVAYVVVLALIDRTTVDILRGLLSDMRQLKTAA
jgi:O-antigen/teichoic acid export membrane protein